MALKLLSKSKGYVFLYLFLSCCFVSSAQREKKTDAERLGIKGKVKLVKESIFNTVMKLGKVEKGSLRYKITYRYNRKGKQIKEAIYDSDGYFDREYMKYDHWGKVVESLIYYRRDYKILFDTRTIYKDVYNNKREQTEVYS